MRNLLLRLFTGVVLLLLLSSVAFSQQRGQRGGGRGNQPAAPSVPHDAHDLQGIWRGGGQSLSNAPPPMTAWGKEQFDAHIPSYGPRAVPPALGNDPLENATR
jgi:hypothetical protein